MARDRSHLSAAYVRSPPVSRNDPRRRRGDAATLALDSPRRRRGVAAAWLQLADSSLCRRGVAGTRARHTGAWREAANSVATALLTPRSPGQGMCEAVNKYAWDTSPEPPWGAIRLGDACAWGVLSPKGSEWINGLAAETVRLLNRCYLTENGDGHPFPTGFPCPDDVRGVALRRKRRPRADIERGSSTGVRRFLSRDAAPRPGFLRGGAAAWDPTRRRRGLGSDAAAPRAAPRSFCRCKAAPRPQSVAAGGACPEYTGSRTTRSRRSSAGASTAGTASTCRSPRGYSVNGSRRRRGCHADTPRRRDAVVATRIFGRDRRAPQVPELSPDVPRHRRGGAAVHGGRDARERDGVRRDTVTRGYLRRAPNVHVKAAASPRSVAALHGISTWQPRRRRDPSANYLRRQVTQ